MTSPPAMVHLKHATLIPAAECMVATITFSAILANSYFLVSFIRFLFNGESKLDYKMFKHREVLQNQLGSA
jgi:hypothetical protein